MLSMREREGLLTRLLDTSAGVDSAEGRREGEEERKDGEEEDEDKDEDDTMGGGTV